VEEAHDCVGVLQKAVDKKEKEVAARRHIKDIADKIHKEIDQLQEVYRDKTNENKELAKKIEVAKIQNKNAHYKHQIDAMFALKEHLDANPKLLQNRFVPYIVPFDANTIMIP